MSKAYSIDYMPNLLSRDQVIDYFADNLGLSRQKANQALHAQEGLLKTRPDRSQIRIDHETGAYRGRKTQLGEAIFGKPTQGGKDNLRNFLNNSLGDRYVTTEELEAILASKYPAEKVPTKLMRARNPKREILKFHPTVRRWSKWGMPTPDFEAADLTGKIAQRVELYGRMPRLKHKPGQKFLLEASEILQWMSQQSGETDLAVVAAEWNRFPRVWVNSVSSESDFEKNLSRAVIVFDRGTGEHLGIITYQDEVKMKSQNSPEPSSTLSKEEKRQLDGLAPVGDEEDIKRSDNGYLTRDYNGDLWYGDPGKEKKIPQDVANQIFDMTRFLG
jgi:hypothetical protein